MGCLGAAWEGDLVPGGDLGSGKRRPHRAEGEGATGESWAPKIPVGQGVMPCPHKQEPLLCTAGPLCKYKHTQRVMCANYLVGFCPEGPKCKFMQYVLGRLGGELGTWLGDSPLPRLQRWPWPLQCLGQGQGCFGSLSELTGPLWSLPMSNLSW